MSDFKLRTLLGAIEAHKDIVTAGKLSQNAANEALWNIAEMMSDSLTGCTGGCCG